MMEQIPYKLHDIADAADKEQYAQHIFPQRSAIDRQTGDDVGGG